MQISRNHSVPAARPAPGPAHPVEPRRSEEASASARAAQLRQASAQPAPAEPEAPAPSLRARLGQAVAGYNQRLEQAVSAQGLTPEQRAAFEQVQSAFLVELHRLSQAHLEEGAPNRALGQGFGRVLENLRAAARELSGPGTPEAGGASPTERLAAVQEALSARLQAAMAQGSRDPRSASAFAQLGEHFEHLFERFQGAIEQAGIDDPRRLLELFDRLLDDLQHSAQGWLGDAGTPPVALYSPSGALQGGEPAPGQVQRLA